ncbi:type II toxin-antitoxin system RelE/ParE family toxin [Kiloniella laminariae]|uniref:Type II toxin-antitoxin system RelE/ParE family toxin n=1 Tax=Kiloniella laminariae TaxID=454162 RepID=A0ABT4LFL4_9PROT|nr:type II toxin-antitoxin system RelE/ParE family toxin [Kiloniella laminariae]MCZ4279890.1 type II toxin-antitoxin system RelE/ParE family toxin [Kiloniella laminariae]
MRRYRLTEAAATDFEVILEYGITTFGSRKALEYQNGMIQRFIQLSQHPERYPVAEQIH